MDHDSHLAEMLEVKNEPHVVEGGIMWIDSSTKTESFIAISTYLLILFLTIRFGIAGDPPIISEQIHREFGNSSAQAFVFDTAPVLHANRFLILDLDCDHAPASSLALSYTVAVFARGFKMTKFERSISPGFTRSSRRLRLFADNYIDYQAVELSVSVDRGDDISPQGLTLHSWLGSPIHTTFQSYFRLIYSIFELIGFYVMLTCLGNRPMSQWTFEQQLTLPGLILGPLSNNPFFMWSELFPRFFFSEIDVIATPLFHAYIYFVVLVMFESMLHKSAPLGFSGWRWKFSLVAVVFVADALSHLNSVLSLISGIPPLTGDKFGTAMIRIQIVGDCVFVVWATFLMIQAVLRVNEGDRFKVLVYLEGSIVLIGFVVFVLILGRMFGWFDDAVEWTLNFCVHNMFTLVLLYLHWPQRMEVERTYEQGATEAHMDEIAEPDSAGVVDDVD
jgi:hypothetical protein